MATKRPEQWKDEDLDVIMALLEKDYTKPEPEKEPEPQLREEAVSAQEPSAEELQWNEPAPAEDKRETAPKKKGKAGLVVILVLEIIVLLGLVGWWIQWLL